MAKQTDNTVIIEVAGENGENLFFPPLQRKFRGRFDYHTPKEPNARKMIDVFPEPIPGQHLELNLDTGEVAILEPLRLSKYEPLAEKIKKRLRCSIPETREEAGTLDLPTAIFWFRRVVDAKLAKVVKGELPTELGGKPRKSFFSQPGDSPTDRLTEAINKQTEAITALLTAFAEQRQPAR